MDRPRDLEKLLASLQVQTYKADQIIIIDGGIKTIDGICNKYPSLKIDYITVRPPGLTKQRNAGMKLLADDITLVGYLDDDLKTVKDTGIAFGTSDIDELNRKGYTGKGDLYGDSIMDITGDGWLDKIGDDCIITYDPNFIAIAEEPPESGYQKRIDLIEQHAEELGAVAA